MVKVRFNLLVSTQRGRENDCISELWYLLREIGDENAVYRKTGIPGLVIAKTKLNPFEAVRRLMEIAEERPWEFRYVLKVTPIEVTTETDIEKIKEAVKPLIQKICEDETFRITVNKRASTLRSRDIIREVASLIDRKVDLNNPDKIVQIEVLGKYTGISILKRDDILSIAKVREEFLNRMRRT
ncbi:MAG: THUMP domain-containing protein [Candidatus Verstraetearchaeota archaeon]|nr:THUMP domain-containing protein [Candidatus Verstraetearchaeota archaeon]